MSVASAMSRAAIFLLVVWGAGCEAQSADSGQADEPEAAANVEAPEAELQAVIDVRGPEGWASKGELGGSRWSSPKGDVELYFGLIGSAGEARAAAEARAARWGVSDMRWGEEQKIAIGAERLPALAADAWCKTRAGEGTIAYATTETARGTLLVMYVLGKDASAEAREAAMTAVASFQKK